jgi:competence protein ComEC
VEEEALDLDAMPGARCSVDACVAAIRRGGRTWRLLALRSRYRLDWTRLTDVCRWADIVVADRRLPRGCTPRWLRLDAPALRWSGGVAIVLAQQDVRVTKEEDGHPWAIGATLVEPAGATMPRHASSPRRRLQADASQKGQ